MSFSKTGPGASAEDADGPTDGGPGDYCAELGEHDWIFYAECCVCGKIEESDG